MKALKPTSGAQLSKAQQQERQKIEIKCRELKDCKVVKVKIEEVEE